ncbi:hypothetical protein P154DRAFT_554604 [Amniculicola lignicola CBS 123094]|uniref:Uncharacterized protein n=1 Tax=Amniculicola lignicola CBS 123094 TaxID=1392246 RepID=A0A6A5WDQ8_9PLEO|nr:hypothetical protein P154DRAFT_554604 [Amniculicola lignicola CBS 123094]
MKSTYASVVAVLATLSGVAVANSAIDGALFHDDDGYGPGHAAAMSSTPMWHFGRPLGQNPCYPEAAETNGRQTDGNSPDSGINPSRGCADPGPWTGQNSQGNPFPVYYTIKQCSANDMRIGYSIYFKHDSGHKSDWENVIVKWSKPDESVNNWTRVEALLGFHGKWKSYGWNDIQNTVDGWADLMTQDKKGANHPKVYVGAWGHAVFHDRYTPLSTWNALAPRKEFRSNDWYWFPDDGSVQPGTLIKDEWEWGQADTNPATLRTWRDICAASNNAW